VIKLRHFVVALGGALVGGLALTFAHEGHSHDTITAKGIHTDAEGRLVIDPAARRAIGLATARADLGSLDEELLVTGRVLVPPDRRAFASTRVQGFVREVFVRPGQDVQAGDALATVESPELISLHQEVRQAELDLALAESNLERVRGLGEAVVSGSDAITLEAERDERSSALASVRRELAALSSPPGAVLPVVAPISGRVVDVDVVVGAFVEPTQHLFEVHDLREVWIDLEVSETDAARV